jgi:hypothetical protein
LQWRLGVGITAKQFTWLLTHCGLALARILTTDRMTAESHRNVSCFRGLLEVITAINSITKEPRREQIRAFGVTIDFVAKEDSPSCAKPRSESRRTGTNDTGGRL